MTNTDENTLYARYLAARFAAEKLPAPPWPADPDHLAAASVAHVIGCACRGRSLEDLPGAPEVAARVAALLSAAPPIPAAKPVSGAAIADAASEPGYAAPELREQAQKPRPACTCRLADEAGRPMPHRGSCPRRTQADTDWCLAQWNHMTHGCGAPRDLPENMGPLPAGIQVPDQFVRVELPERWPWPAVRAALKLIDPSAVRIAMDRDTITVSGPLTASAKADPESAFRAIPDLREFKS